MEYITKEGRRYEIMDYVPFGVMRFIAKLQDNPNDFDANMGLIKELIVGYPNGFPKDPTKLPLADINEILETVIGPLFRKFEEGMRNIAKR